MGAIQLVEAKADNNRTKTMETNGNMFSIQKESSKERTYDQDVSRRGMTCMTYTIQPVLVKTGDQQEKTTNWTAAHKNQPAAAYFAT